MWRALLRRLFGARRKLAGERVSGAQPSAAADPRVASDPWLQGLLADLGERYKLGDDQDAGTQLLRRTGRARFNPMRVWLRAGEKLVAGEYEVRAHEDLEKARALLDARVTAPLLALGLSQAEESVEEWGGQLLARRYQGRCDDARTAAAAVRFFCEESEQQLDTAAE